MLKGKILTAIIPVRGGSKRLPGKNTRKIGKYSLLERDIKLAQGCDRVDRVLVSTDDPEMYGCAETYGVAAPTIRPADLADDSATTVSVVEHLIGQAAIDDGYLLLLQASSPLRTIGDLNALLDHFEDSVDTDAIVSLCDHTGAHPEKLQKIADGRVMSYLGVDSHRPEQSLSKVYALNGAFYLVDRGTFLREKSFIPTRTIAYQMPFERSVNLDTKADWNILQAMLSAGYWNFEEYD
ncbi:MAG: acylneuraminate cytidylyltransferase family protein [Proteobacteria bacterium]|nr:acylneuraminate cytidylyltransferase family protein [Pseudomonadota bacterium]